MVVLNEKKVAFLTTIFPMDLSYLYDFLNSLKHQTYENFDIIVVNDGYKKFEELISKYKKLRIVELNYSNTPLKNREFGINYVIKNNYDILIFGDSDDYFALNRIEDSVKNLEKFDIVVNDLSLFNKNGIYLKKYISNRIRNNTEIKLDFIKDKNIFGLSNTAVKVSVLKNIVFYNDLIALDWYIFTILLLRNNRAIFLNSTVTFYRQHMNNLIGIGSNTVETIQKCIEVKSIHYRLLQNEDIIFKELHKKIEVLKNKIGDSKSFTELFMQRIKTPLWWEDVKF